MMSNGSRQVSLAEADATIDKERIIFLARPLGDCQCGGVGQLVARPDDEFGKRELGIQLGAEWALLGLICMGPCCNGPLRPSFRRLMVSVAAAIPVRSFAP